MASETEVVWKCGACNECFYDIHILASHKCIGNGNTVALSESCIKELEVQSYDVADLNASSEQVQDLGSLNIIDGQEITELPYASASYHKPTIISIKKNSEFKKHQKGKRSIVWTYFTALDEKKAMCCICQKVISYCGTPTNLVYHLSRYHPIEGDVVKSKQANNIKYQYLSNKLPKPCISEKKRVRNHTINIIPQVSIEKTASLTVIPKKPNITDKIIEMMLVDMLPVTVLEGSGFKRLINSLDPSYKMPSVKEFFIDHIPKKYYVEYKKVQNLLKEAEKVHTSIELWTGYNEQNFLTVSAHFVTSDFQYKHYSLNTFYVNDINPEHLMTHIVTSISQWDLSMDVMCIVTDGSETMSKTSELTGWRGINCFAHILDDIIKTSLSSSPELLGLMEKCRTVVNFLRSNESAKQQLLEAQMHDKNVKMQHAQSQVMDINAAVDVKYPLKVKKDNSNEWISSFYMLQRIATLKNVLTKILANFSSSIEILTKNDWTAIEETISLLKAFEVVILELCNEPYQFASKVIPVTLGLNSLINNCNTLTLPTIERVRKDILTALRKRLGQVEHNLMLAMATILDPRFKNIAFQSEVAVETAIQELTREASKHASNNSVMDISEKESKEVSSCTDSLWEGFERKAIPKKAPSRTDDVISNEIKHYLEEPLLDRKKNPFLWWKTQGQAQFPILAEIAKQILSIPATSIPPERVFLKKGRIFSEKRR
ncbi:Zinc finger BED domain-containing protein 4, partial [Stegodyphus mimosarum]